MNRKLFSVIVILAILLSQLPGSVFAAAPASGQAVEPVPDPVPAVNAGVVNAGPTSGSVPHIYLPMIVASGNTGSPPASSSPYAAALSQALADCAGTALNQVCYARGSLTLDGGGPLTTPGQAASLEGISGLRLASPDAGHWSVALLRLAADSPTPDLGLTLLAFGNVEIHNLTLFDAAAGNGDVAPALSFSSSPVPGEDPVTGSLIVYNPNHEEPLSIRLNGADLTLASSAVLQAQPGDKMTITEATGSAVVQTAAGEGALIQNHQLNVPLDGDGTASGTPTTPTKFSRSQWAAILPPLGDDLLAFIVPPQSPQDIASTLRDIDNQFENAYDRCVQGNSRQVYRIMYFARILKLYQSLYPNYISDSIMELYNLDVRNCATFEIEFNSVITTTSSVAWGSMYVQGQGMIVSYNMDGSLVQPAEMPLTHQRYNMNYAIDPCLLLEIIDGSLGLSDGYMRINRNRLDISTTVMHVGVEEKTTFVCEDPHLPMANPAEWRLLFRNLHASEFSFGYHFTPAHWKYTGNQILAEAIFHRELRFEPRGVTNGDTWLVMLHKPGG